MSSVITTQCRLTLTTNCTMRRIGNRSSKTGHCSAMCTLTLISLLISLTWYGKRSNGNRRQTMLNATSQMHFVTLLALLNSNSAFRCRSLPPHLECLDYPTTCSRAYLNELSSTIMYALLSSGLVIV